MMTTKNTKTEVFAEVERVLAGTKKLEKSLKDRAKYIISKGIDAVTKSDLLQLLGEMSPVTALPVENSAKPQLKKPTKLGKKSEAENTTDEAPKAEEKTQETPKKSSKPKAKVKEAPKLSKKSFSVAKIFPETIEVKNLGTLELRNEEFRTMEDVSTALNEGREIFFATYWNARQLKEFDYAGVNRVPCPKSFENDLDILMAVVACTNIERVWCMSALTEAMYCFDSGDLEPVTEKDVNGEEYAIRVANGLEFEIYERVSTTE